MSKDITYYKIKDDRISYLGERYYKYDLRSDSVLQVSCGRGTDSHRNRSTAIGVYVIARLTFMSNFLSIGYVVPIDRKLFDEKYTEMVKNLHTPL